MGINSKQCKLIVQAFCLTVILAALNIAPASGQSDNAQSAKKVYVSTGHEGTISGVINFRGEAPERKRIDSSADPVCFELDSKMKTEDVFIKNGKLGNVFVYVKGASALETYSFEMLSTEAVLEHKGCHYVPHLLGIRTEQTLKVVNSDPTTHNTHPTPKTNKEWNQSQQTNAPPIVVKFDRPEQFIPFKCNQHPWEKAYVGVFAHPFFTISDEDGAFQIKGLPPGDYTLVAWHEKFGEKEMKLTIVPYESKVVDFTFEGVTP